MFDTKQIINILKDHIEKTDKFIIYPFGANGLNVKNVLENYFNVQPFLIVDNEYSKYNSKIINKKMLRDVYEKDMYVILTVEDDIINTQILSELSEYVSVTNIINLKNRNSHKKKIGEIKTSNMTEKVFC